MTAAAALLASVAWGVADFLGAFRAATAARSAVAL
jgi:hypothetical protein